MHPARHILAAVRARHAEHAEMLLVFIGHVHAVIPSARGAVIVHIIAVVDAFLYPRGAAALAMEIRLPLIRRNADT